MLPQIFRILAVELGEGYSLVRHRGISAKDDITVKIETADGSPFVADQRGESAGLIVFVGQRRVALPSVFDQTVAGDGRIGLLQ